MALEIERKFLVKESWKPEGAGHLICQGYLPQREGSPFTVRVRRSGEQAYLCIKGRNTGVTRAEFEYPIPLADAAELLARLEKCGESFIHKRRYIVPYEGHNWEVDVFAGLNEGLRVAEIELSSEAESFQKPDWVGRKSAAIPGTTMQIS